MKGALFSRRVLAVEDVASFHSFSLLYVRSWESKQNCFLTFPFSTSSSSSGAVYDGNKEKMIRLIVVIGNKANHPIAIKQEEERRRGGTKKVFSFCAFQGEKKKSRNTKEARMGHRDKFCGSINM